MNLILGEDNRVAGFVLKDCDDTMIDKLPWDRWFQFRSQNSSPPNSIGLAHFLEEEGGSSVVRRAGLYAFQSILSFESDPEHYPRMMKAFVDAYLERAMDLVDGEANLDPSFARALFKLDRGRYSETQVISELQTLLQDLVHGMQWAQRHGFWSLPSATVWAPRQSDLREYGLSQEFYWNSRWTMEIEDWGFLGQLEGNSIRFFESGRNVTETLIRDDSVLKALRAKSIHRSSILSLRDTDASQAEEVYLSSLIQDRLGKGWDFHLFWDPVHNEKGVGTFVRTDLKHIVEFSVFDRDGERVAVPSLALQGLSQSEVREIQRIRETSLCSEVFSDK